MNAPYDIAIGSGIASIDNTKHNAIEFALRDAGFGYDEAFRIAALACIEQSANCDLACVPIKPTAEMCEAAFRAAGSPSDWDGFDEMWKAAIDAAPRTKPSPCDSCGGSGVVGGFVGGGAPGYESHDCPGCAQVTTA